MLKTRNNMTFARVLWLSWLTPLTLGTLILIGCTVTSPHNTQDPMSTGACSFLPPADPDYIPTYDHPVTSFELIDSAWLDSEITTGERLIYTAYGLYEPSLLPSRFIGTRSMDGTASAIELDRAAQDSGVMCQLSVCEQVELKRLLGHGADCVNAR